MDYIDPGWTMANDRQSVTVGINTRVWLCRKQGLVPNLVRLGREHTRLFLREQGLYYIPNAPFRSVSGLIDWDPGLRCIVYGPGRIPMRLNDRKIYGIAVEGEPGKRI
jgi:hypothetical protein